MRSNFEVIEEFKFLLRQLERLREGFRLEKESALDENEEMTLEDLLERSRSHYRMKLAGISRRIRRLRGYVSQDRPAWEEAVDISEECVRKAKKLDAYFTATPHRLIRAMKKISGTGIPGPERDEN